jgi:phosphomannomutase
VDPDVDRVAFLLPDGTPFGEEYSLVVAVDYILSQQKGPVVANLSTTQAVQQIAERYGVPFHASAVGEYHVVQKMKAVGAVIGGEGNGGVIWPAVHYGRDALVGITLMLARLTAFSNAHELRESYPSYYQVKISVPLSESPPDWKALWNHLKAISPTAQAIEIDGLKLQWPQKWVHIRPSGTEPILRIYAEAPTQKEAEDLAAQFKNYLS